MKVFHSYHLPDLVMDADFQHCVREWEAGNDLIWEELLRLNPDEVYNLNRGREILLALRGPVSSLSEQELVIEVEAILANTTRRQKQGLHGSFLRWFSVAAAVLLVMGLLWYQFNNKSVDYSYEGAVSGVGTTLIEEVNNTDEQRSVRLPDGSKVVLLPLSKIRYPLQFTGKNKREIYLSGDAFFDIEKDSLRPLHVYANGLLTRVLGTSFLIRTGESQVQVLVRTGRVAVSSIQVAESRPEGKLESRLIIPNQQAIFSVIDHTISTGNVDFPDLIKNLKREQALSFENLPIAEVFETLERVYGIPFVFNRTVLAKCRLHVSFTDESLFAKLDIITKTIGANYQISDGRVIIAGRGCN